MAAVGFSNFEDGWLNLKSQVNAGIQLIEIRNADAMFLPTIEEFLREYGYKPVSNRRHLFEKDRKVEPYSG